MKRSAIMLKLLILVTLLKLCFHVHAQIWSDLGPCSLEENQKNKTEITSLQCPSDGVGIPTSLSSACDNHCDGKNESNWKRVCAFVFVCICTAPKKSYSIH